MSTADAALFTWRKSSYSGNEGGACLEVATAIDTVHIRDSKDLDRAQLGFSRMAWTAFVQHAALS